MRYREVIKIALANFKKREDLAKMPQPETWYKLSVKTRQAVVYKILDNLADEWAKKHGRGVLQ